MIRIRPATDEDAPAIIKLIAKVYGEFEGVVMDLDGVDAELKAPATSVDRFWVLDLEGTVLGTAACSLYPDHAELKKMYIDLGCRGKGFGRKLVEVVEQAAIQQGLKRIELWSDTRFRDAHAFYEKLGYKKTGEIRDLHDPSDTTELQFVKDL